jgi:serine/threonine protein kinase
MSWNQGHLLKSGQYEVVRLLGSGGFGMTYLAKDLNLERQVVIKRPNLSFEADRDYDKFLRRFKREGQVLAQVQIPNIVRVIEFTEIGGMPCLVMDFVAGETLNDCIRRRGYIPEDEAVRLFQKLASAVEALHQQGIIHCDIHPGNIIVQPNSEPMLIDFGSTKLLHPTTWTVTTTVNKDFGPYDQMAESTENAFGSQPAWDIYSLAANMFFAVTGEKPMSAISRKLYGDSLKAPKELKPDLTDRLNRMILQGTALETKDRSSSVAIWINLLNVSSQPLPAEKISHSTTTESSAKNKKSKSFVTSSPKQIKSNIISPRTKKESRTFSLEVATSFFILGYFLYGVALGYYFELSVFIFAFSGSVGFAFVGALGWNDLLIALFALVSTFTFWNWSAAWISSRIWYWLSLVAILWGYVSSEYRLRENYSTTQVFVIYLIFSWFGLVSGGVLGSWLKVAGILKLP